MTELMRQTLGHPSNSLPAGSQTAMMQEFYGERNRVRSVTSDLTRGHGLLLSQARFSTLFVMSFHRRNAV